MPGTIEDAVARLTQSFDNLASKMESAATVSATATTGATDLIVSSLGSISFGLPSIPPTGGFKITNIYVKDGKLTIEYDDTSA